MCSLFYLIKEKNLKIYKKVILVVPRDEKNPYVK